MLRIFRAFFRGPKRTKDQSAGKNGLASMIEMPPQAASMFDANLSILDSLQYATVLQECENHIAEPGSSGPVDSKTSHGRPTPTSPPPL